MIFAVIYEHRDTKYVSNFVFGVQRDSGSIRVSVATVVGFDSAENDCMFVMYALNYIFAHIFVEFPSLFNGELKLSRLARKHILVT